MLIFVFCSPIIDIAFEDCWHSEENAVMLTVTVQDLGDQVVLRCVGSIVRGEETAILCAAVQQASRDLTLDLSGVDAIDAAGVGALVSLQAAGVYLRLIRPTKQVREVLRLTHLDSVFECFESHSEENESHSLRLCRT